MTRYLLLLFLFASSLVIGQNQYLDRYDVLITAANVTATNDQGWVTVADVQVDSTTQRLAVLKFDMCGDLEWSYTYHIDGTELHHGEIIQNSAGGYVMTCSNADLSQGHDGYYLIELDLTGAVVRTIHHSNQGGITATINIGTDLLELKDDHFLTEMEMDGRDKGLGLFDDNGDLKWMKIYDGLTRMGAPMAIERVNDSMIFVTNTNQVAMLDTTGEVLWAMKNDSMVIWPEIAVMDDQTVGILVSPWQLDSTEMATNRRSTYLVTFPQGTPNPVMHKGFFKSQQVFPELHSVGGKYVVASLDSIPELQGFAQTFTKYDEFGTPEEHKYLGDFLSAGLQENMPFIGFDQGSGFTYLTYTSADTAIYFAKMDGNTNVGDMMACMPAELDTFLDEPLSWWESHDVTTDSVRISIDTAEIIVTAMDTIQMMRQCENMIPDGEQPRPICPGDTIIIGGRKVFEEGTYMDTMMICGEDVITTYEVFFIELPDRPVEREICDMADSTFFGGQWLKTPGTYRVTFRECGQDVDSILTLSYVPRNPDPEPIMRTVCPGTTISFNHPVTGVTTELTFEEAFDTTFTIEYPDPDPMVEDCGYILRQRYEFAWMQSTQDVIERIPNAFTPNGDNMNDAFGFFPMEMDSIEFTSFGMTIFTRWGQEVFKTTDIDQKWNGRFDGEDLVSEVYLYIIEIVGDLNGCLVTGSYKGDVTLIR